MKDPKLENSFSCSSGDHSSCESYEQHPTLGLRICTCPCHLHNQVKVEEDK
jgi:hypothetical protein